MARHGNVDTGFATLRDALAAHTVQDLKPLAALLAKQLPTRKDDLIAVIEEALAGEGLRKMWEGMDPLSQAAVAEVTHGSDEYLYIGRFEAKYGKAPSRYHYASYPATSSPWTLLDVVFTQNAMPRDLKERFRAFVPPPMREKVATLDALPEAVPVDEDSEESEMEPLEVCQTTKGALHDLVAVLRLVDAGKVSVSATTLRPALGGAKAVLAVLRDGDFVADKEIKKADDFIRAFAWPLIVQAAGWARLAGSKLELTKAGREALARPAHEGIRHAWKRWLDKGLIDEFSRIDAIKGQNRKKNGGLTRVAPRRAALQKILSTCPPEKWIDIDEFFRHILATDTEYDVSDDPWSLYIGDAQYGNLAYGGGDTWSMVEGRYAMVLLWEYAATLGLLDIAHVPPDWARNDYLDHWGAEDLECLSRYDGLKFFRITALGAYCLGIAKEYVPEPFESRSVFKVLPTREIVVQDAAGFTAADALFLDRIAVQSGDHTWSLEKARILEALESGIQAEEIIEFLTALSGSPLPDNVRHFIDDTIRRALMVTFEGAAEVFRVADEATALLILHDATGKSLCYAAGPTRLIVPARNITAFRRVLRQLGFVAPKEKGGS